MKHRRSRKNERSEGVDATRSAGAAPRAGLRRRVGLLGALALVAAAAAVVWLPPLWREAQPWEPKAVSAAAEPSAQEAAPSPEIVAIHQEVAHAVGALVEQFPDDPNAVDAVAQFYHFGGRIPEAEACWGRCLELDPSLGDIHFSLAGLARDQGDHARAAEHFRRAKEQGASASGITYHLGLALMSAGRLDEAAEVLREDVRINSRAVASLVLLGQIDLQRSRFAEAKESFEAAIALAPDVSGAYYGAGTAYARLGDKEKSQKCMERHRQLKAKDAEDHRSRLRNADDVRDRRFGAAQVLTAAGKVYYAHGDAQTAQGLWQRAAQLAPQDREPGLILAWSYEQQGRMDEALERLTEEARTRPDDAEVQVRLGQLCLRMKRPEAAERAFGEAVRLAPKDGFGYAALAHLYLQTGRSPGEAKTMAAKAAELTPAGPHYYLLAVASLRSGDSAGALSAIQKALARDPANPQFRELRDLIRKGE